jgi:hypothetical protein
VAFLCRDLGVCGAWWRVERRLPAPVIADALGQFMTSSTELDAAKQWEEQLDLLRERVEQWTGNALQVVDLSFHDWRRPTASRRLPVARQTRVRAASDADARVRLRSAGHILRLPSWYLANKVVR